MASRVPITWLTKPQAHDYAAALSYLGLLYDDKKAAKAVGKLKSAPMKDFKSKDVFRASGLPLLGISNFHVAQVKSKIMSKEKLSPILLVRDSRNGKVIIADGYHRMCAVYYYDEDAV